MRCNRMILDVLDLVNATQCTQTASSVTPVLFRKSDSTNPGTQGRHSIATGNPRTSLKPEARRCKVAWHCTLQGISRIERTSLAPCKLKGIHSATFFPRPTFHGQKVGSQRLAHDEFVWAATETMGHDGRRCRNRNMESPQNSNIPSEDWVFDVELPTVIPTYLLRMRHIKC